MLTKIKTQDSSHTIIDQIFFSHLKLVDRKILLAKAPGIKQWI